MLLLLSDAKIEQHSTHQWSQWSQPSSYTHHQCHGERVRSQQQCPQRQPQQHPRLVPVPRHEVLVGDQVSGRSVQQWFSRVICRLQQGSIASITKKITDLLRHCQ